MRYSRQILTLAAALALAAVFPAIVYAQVPDPCPILVESDTVLGKDLLCVNSNGLIVGADGVTIDLGGHTIKCIAVDGAPQHCQGLGFVGINTNGFNNLTIKNGTVDRFDIGIHVNGGGNVAVQDVMVTGPTSQEFVDRANATGILVDGIRCHTGANIDGNKVYRHRYGIQLVNSSCAKIQRNTVEDNDGASIPSHGILLMDSSGNTLTNNQVNFNGANLARSGGITLAGTSRDNRVARNTALSNCGDGISALDAADFNTISGNSARSNSPGISGECPGTDFPFYDLADRSSGVNNKWARTNDCWTEGGSVPADVCNPGE